jgi:hypothetical protein
VRQIFGGRRANLGLDAASLAKWRRLEFAIYLDGNRWRRSRVTAFGSPVGGLKLGWLSAGKVSG